MELEQAHLEGKTAYRAGEIANPHQAQIIELAQAWHGGWVNAAGLHTLDDIRAYISNLQAENVMLHKRVKALQKLCRGGGRIRPTNSLLQEIRQYREQDNSGKGSAQKKDKSFIV